MEINLKCEKTNNINSRIDEIYKSLHESNEMLESIQNKLSKLVYYQYKRELYKSNDVIECEQLEPTVVDRLDGLIIGNKEINEYLNEVMEHLSQVL